MPSTCVVGGCTRNKTKNPDIIFSRFPLIPATSKEWVKFVENLSWNTPVSIVIIIMEEDNRLNDVSLSISFMNHFVGLPDCVYPSIIRIWFDIVFVPMITGRVSWRHRKWLEPVRFSATNFDFVIVFALLPLVGGAPLLVALDPTSLSPVVPKGNTSSSSIL